MALPCGEQLHRPVDAGHAAGQHGDAVGGLLRLALLAVDPVGEHDEADDEQHQERRSMPSKMSLTPPKKPLNRPGLFFLFLPHRLLQRLPGGARIGTNRARMKPALLRCSGPKP